MKCGGGLAGGEIHIAGLSGTMTDVLVRLERLEGATQIARLEPSAPSLVVEATPSRVEVVRYLFGTRCPAYSIGCGSSAVCSGFAAVGARRRTAGEDRERVYDSA